MTTPLASYLKSYGSLTAQLEALAGQKLRVEIVFEGFMLLDGETYQAVRTLYGELFGQLPAARPLAWVRQVRLYGDDGAWVVAKSVILARHLHGKAHRLRHLHATPMGYVLFKHQKTLPTARTFSQDGQARQTLYNWQGVPVWIEERFLVGFLARVKKT